MKAFTWVDPAAIPDAAHLLHHADVWAPVNDRGEVAVYDKGTGPYCANAPQCNRSRSIAERLVPRVPGAVGVEHFDHLYIADSPSRYF